MDITVNHSYTCTPGTQEISFSKYKFPCPFPFLFLQAGGGEKKEHLYKILVIGELGTGKTSIIKRYVHQFFSQHYRATIGVDFALKVLNWDAETIVRLQLWDIAGKEMKFTVADSKVRLQLLVF